MERTGIKHFLKFIQFLLLSNIIKLLEDLGLIEIPIIKYLTFSIALLYFLNSVKILISFKTLPTWDKIMIFIFVSWGGICILRGIPTILEGYKNYIHLKNYLSGTLITYLMPIIIIIRPNLQVYRKLFHYGFIFSVIGIFIIPFVSVIYSEKAYYGIETLSRIFAASGAIILLTSKYHKKQKLYLTLISVVIALLILIIFARRNMIVYFASVLTFSLYLNTFFGNHKFNYRFLKTISILLGSLFVGLILYYNFDLFSFSIQRFQTGFDSRSEIINEFINDFNNTPKDWIWGRGILGEFKTSILIVNEDLGTRNGIENGYFDYILKGGGLYLGLLILISFKAIFLGLYRSNNLLSKAFAFLILINLIDMIGFGLPSINIKHLIIWIAISASYSHELRQMKDFEIAPYIRL